MGLELSLPVGLEMAQMMGWQMVQCLVKGWGLVILREMALEKGWVLGLVIEGFEGLVVEVLVGLDIGRLRLGGFVGLLERDC